MVLTDAVSWRYASLRGSTLCCGHLRVSTRRRCAFTSFDTSTSASHPSTRWHWDHYTFVSRDTSAIDAPYPRLVGFGAGFAFFYTLALGPPSAFLLMIWWEVVIVLKVAGGTWCLVRGMYRWWAELIDGWLYSAVVGSQVVDGRFSLSMSSRDVRGVIGYAGVGKGGGLG
jgi:hypothetical protein